jgi:hypothetical protein
MHCTALAATAGTAAVTAACTALQQMVCVKMCALQCARNCSSIRAYSCIQASITVFKLSAAVLKPARFLNSSAVIVSTLSSMLKA